MLTLPYILYLGDASAPHSLSHIFSRSVCFFLTLSLYCCSWFFVWVSFGFLLSFFRIVFFISRHQYHPYDLVDSTHRSLLYRLHLSHCHLLFQHFQVLFCFMVIFRYLRCLDWQKKTFKFDRFSYGLFILMREGLVVKLVYINIISIL